MKEEYLHQIWLTKRLPMHQLVLTDGRKLDIKNTGWHNHASGPDFFNGSIQLDGITWNGNIEIHIKSSDWYAHKHHLDEAYNNVILHVVYKHDKPVFVQGEEIPTLELQPLLDKKHWFSYESLVTNNNWIPCQYQMQRVDPFFVAMQVENSLIERLQRKAEILELRFQLLGRNLQQLQYETLAQAFGSKINALPFVELTHRMPVKTIWREGPVAAPALLLGAAGFLETAQENAHFKQLQHEWNFHAVKHRLHAMNRHSWKFKGLRPPGFPDVRIAQFADAVTKMQQDFSFFEKTPEELIRFFRTIPSFSAKSTFTHAFQDRLLINAIVPLLWWYGNHRSEAKFREKAMDLLEKIQPENNEVIKSWAKLGIKCKSAGDSQGLLELKNEICDQKKCLSCKIGQKILGK